MYIVGKGFLGNHLHKAKVVYRIPARSLAAVAALTATVLHATATYFHVSFLRK